MTSTALIVVVQGSGRTLAEQDGRQAILETGDLALFDSVRPYFAQLQIYFFITTF